MKNCFKVLALLSGFLFAACSGSSGSGGGGESTAALTGISITASAESMEASGSVQLTASPVPSSVSATYTWSITEGSEYADLSATSGKTVTLSGKNAGAGSVKVKLTAYDGKSTKTTSKSIAVTASSGVTPELKGVSISGTTEIEADATGTLTATPSYTGDIDEQISYAWEITSGSTYATISGNGASVTITGKNTTTSSQSVTVKVTATYETTSKTATQTVTVAAQGVVIPDAITGLELIASSSTVAPDGTVTLTPKVTYTGSVSESQLTVSGWNITAGGSYASLKVPSTGASRSVMNLTGDNRSILQANNTTTSSQTVTASVTVTFNGHTETADCTVTVGAASVDSVSISGTTTLSAYNGSTTLTANVSKTGNPASVTYNWEITDGSEYAEITAGASTASAVITGTNDTASAHTVTVKVTVSDGKNSKTATQTVSVPKNTTLVSPYFPENGAADAYADTYLEIEFDSAPVINRASSGTVRIYTSGGTLVDTIKPAAETMYGYGYSGNSGLGSINVQYQLIQVVDTNKVRIIPHHNTSTGMTLLSNNTAYYVLIDSGIITGTIGGSSFAGITDSSVWAFTTGSAPSPSGSTLTVGEGKQFITVQGAMSYLMKNSKTGTWTIKIEPGTYYERVFYHGSANLILSGQGSATYGTDVEIQWCNQDGGDPTKVTNTLWNYGSRGRNVFYYAGKDLTIENISFVNTATRYTNSYGEYDSGASDTANGNNQAEALMFDSTGNCAAYNCNFKSKQDTIYLSPSGGKAWFYGCKISGDIDFIWGLSDVALIERCNIISTYDARATNTYVVAPHLATGTAPYGKGFVLYNCDITTESGQKTYLARSPWGSSGNISQVAIIDTAVTGGLESNPWYESHVGGDDETVLGWKWYGVTSEGSSISAANKLSQAQYEAEFAGRNNIINRTYDGSAFSKAASTWDVNALAQTMGWNVVTDNSKATLDGENEITTVTYDFTAQTSYSAWDSITSISAEGDSTNTATVSGLKWHSTNYGANVSAANSTVSFAVTGACTVTVYNSYTMATDVSLAVGGATVDTGSTSGSDSCTLSYTGTTSGTAVVTIASSGAYISKIVVTYTSSGGGEGGDDTTNDSWTWTASDYADGITTDKTSINADSVLGNVTISGTGATWRVSNSTPYCMETGKAANGCLKFTTSATATIAIVAASTGSSNKSDAILSTSADTSGAIAEASGATTVTGSNPQTTLTYNNVAAGTYYFGAFPASTNGRGIRVYSITVTADGSSSGGNSGGSSSGETTSTISLSDTPTGYAGYSSPSYYTGSSTITINASDANAASTLMTYVKKGNYVIYINGMIDVTSGKLPDSWEDTGNALGSFISSYTDGTYTSWTAWRKAYAGACDETSHYTTGQYTKKATNALVEGTNDETLDGYQTALAAAWKKLIQLPLASNTTIIGLTDESGIRGANISISGISNVMLRNLHLQDAFDPFPHHEYEDGWNAEYDCITIQNTNSYIWIDHCTFEDTISVGWEDFAGVKTGDADADVVSFPCNSKGEATTSGYEMWQTYDGLCDIKGSTSNVTVSYCVFRNHDKCMLIGNSDSESVTAASRTITLHHNYYCGAVQRLPMARLSYIHNFNNYYGVPSTSNGYDQKAAVNARYGVYINSEYNYFDSGLKYSYNSSDSTANLYYYGDAGSKKDSTSLSSLTYTTTEGAYVFDIPYSYSDYLNEADGLKTLLEDNAGAGVWSVEE